MSAFIRNVLRHDFNHPRNEGGFHEVILPSYIVRSVEPGDTVVVQDDDDTGPRITGRVRCLVAIIEEITDTGEGSAS